MKWGRYLLYCFGRGHAWVDAEGKSFEVTLCMGNHFWQPLLSDCKKKKDFDSWGHNRPTKAIVTSKGRYTKKNDRVCADCEKVELNETDPIHAREIAAEILKVNKEEAAKQLKMELKAARTGPHPRALTSEEDKLVEDFMYEQDRRIERLRKVQ